MAKLTKESVVAEALDLLDEVGLDDVTTRRLADRLGVKQPSLYWHFQNKEELLHAMAAAAMAPHANAPLPVVGEDWREWFLENYRSFRRTLLAHRDGARLHAGSTPTETDFGRAVRKLEFLIDSGVSRQDAQAALLASSHFTVGFVLEEQAASDTEEPQDESPGPQPPDADTAFDAGLGLLLDGLAHRAPRSADSSSRRPSG